MDKPTLVDLRTRNEFKLGEILNSEFKESKGIIESAYGYRFVVPSEYLKEFVFLWNSYKKQTIDDFQEKIDRQKEYLKRGKERLLDNEMTDEDTKYMQKEIREIEDDIAGYKKKLEEFIKYTNEIETGELNEIMGS